ncbi:hypothetical protein Droror1_Dr00026767 [Drosera rotundifolia]
MGIITTPSSLLTRLFHTPPQQSDPFLPARAKTLTNTILSHLDANRLRKSVSLLFAAPFQFPFPLYAKLFNLCSSARAIVEARKVESHLLTYSNPPPTFLLNRAIECYGFCGCLRDARELFDEMPRRDGGSWNAMIGACGRCGGWEEGMGVFREMNGRGVRGSVVTFASVVGLCGAVLEVGLARQVHGMIVKGGFDGNVILGTALVDVYGKCRGMRDARRAFDEIEEKSDVSWNVIVRRYLEVGDEWMAIGMFSDMVRAGVSPLTFTVSNALVACSGCCALMEGTLIHGLAIKLYYDEDEVVSSSLIDMYSKCGSLDGAWKIFYSSQEKTLISWTSMVSGYAVSGRTQEARELFDQMPERNIVSWNAMLTGYIQYNLWNDALNLIYLMFQEEKCKVDSVTLGLILNICSGLSDVELGKQIHGYIYRHGFFSHVVIGNSLLDMYGKCGSLRRSCTWFCEMADFRDSVSWNSLMRTYAGLHLSEEVMGIFARMQQETFPNEYTFSILLASCADICAIKQGMEIHGFIIRNGYVRDDVLLGAMVDMYSKCRIFDYALRVFYEATPGSLILWNSVIFGCCHHHKWEEAIQLFELMKIKDVQPDHVTFLAILQACIGGVFIERGAHYFHSMSTEYYVMPHLEHYECMIELCSKHGFMNELEEFVKNLPFSATIPMLTRIFDACREYGNSRLGNWVANKLNELNQ